MGLGMTEQEAQKLCYEINVAFPNWKPDPNAIVKLWATILKDEDFEQLHLAFCVYCRTDLSGFAPTPAQLLNIIAKANDNSMTDAEAWALVSKAIRRSAYYSNEEFEKLPEDIQRAVGSAQQLATWATDSEYNEGVTQSHFLRSYRTVQSRKHEQRLLPTSLRQALLTEAKV